MRDAIKDLNKHTLAEATGISYSKLRKYATGLVKNLTPEERDKIYIYLVEVAERFKADTAINQEE